MEKRGEQPSGKDPGDYEARHNGRHDLMRFKIRDILLVSSLYDAFILEEDGGLSEQIFGEYRELELTSSPRVIRVSSAREAERELWERRYDMVITMTHLVDLDPLKFGKRAKKLQPGIPVVLLATDRADLENFHMMAEKEGIDKVFFWNGDSSLFLAIIKYFEDRMNAEPDTRKGMVHIILVIEDSARYQSMFLPQMYKEIVHQTRSLVEQSLNEHEKLLRRRARPKILLAETYEEAMEIYEDFKDYILAIVSDIAFPKNGKKVADAGFRFIKAIDRDIPVIMQSSQAKYKNKAEQMGLPFLSKNSDTMLQDLREFFTEELGFGDFVFKLPDGSRVGRARDMDEFTDMVKKVPSESLLHHAKRNDFSLWLMARGEYKLAMDIRPKRIDDFGSHHEIRDYLVAVISKASREKQLGVITDFSQQKFEYEQTFTRLGGGSLGGKGRGIAFMAALLHQSDLAVRFPEHPVSIPSTLVLGTEEFDRFVDDNELHETFQEDIGDQEVARRFINAKFSAEVRKSLGKYLRHVSVPLAVRSSSLLEDSYNQPFAGIYATYILPNNNPDDDRRLDQLCRAIKLVYASAFFKPAKAYIQSTLHKAEEERMAVVIQMLMGNDHDGMFYPVFSGVAQSHNYYPLPPLEREEGIVGVALGLGKIVVEGGQVMSFSPRRPDSIPGFSSTRDILSNSQREFFALDMSRQEFDLRKEGEDATLACHDISRAEKDGTLDYLASVYDPNDDIIRHGPYYEGTKVITFAPIIKLGQYPLVELMQELLEIGTKGMGGPVEMEFAADLDAKGELELHILQIRPLLSMREHKHVAIDKTKERGDYLAYSSRALGNGRLDNLRDIIYVPPEVFDRAKTLDIASEIGKMNKRLEGRPYLLIGPGRWGSNDRWLGIPVNWGHISGARAILETPILDLRVDPSQGSHFFHNITSLGIPYLTVTRGSKEDFVDWDWLKEQPVRDEDEHVRHLHLSFPLVVKVDGRCGHGVIRKSKIKKK